MPTTNTRPACPYCGRSPLACWVMPCLQLEQILAQGADAVNSWLKSAGADFKVEDR